MERFPAAVTKAFQHGHLLSIKQKEYREWVLSFLDLQLGIDKRQGDMTVKALFSDPSAPMKSQIEAKETGIVAGLEELSAFCASKKIRVSSSFKDGGKIETGRVVAQFQGSAASLLETERIRLDLLGRMSGIATLTRRLSKVARSVPLAATRKTLWGPLDKKAVYIGGGLTHRLGLWQAVLIKDNHLTALGNLDVTDPFVEALSSAKIAIAKKKIPFVEIEAQSLEEALEVLQILQNTTFDCVPTVLLDNFSTGDIQNVIKTLEKRKLRKRVLVELSGGITEKNLAHYAKTKPDLMSLGMLTHSSPALDFSEEIVVEPREEPRE